MEIRLDGRVAVITGASAGLGLAMAQRFAASGAAVAMLARRPDVLEAAEATAAAGARGKVRAYSCDVTNGSKVESTVAAIEREFGRIDILVNNAGSSMRGPFETLTDAMWQQDFDLKLFAAIRLIRMVWPGMKARRWGRIVNVLNIGAKAPPAAGAPTAVTRAAGLALTKVLAGEGAPHNILVNALHVGIIDSEQWTRRHKNEAANIPYEQWKAERGRKEVPLGRLGEAEEFANMACFLVSEQASYVTGTSINVDGGKSPVW